VNASDLGTYTNIYPAYDDLVTGVNTFNEIVGAPLNGTWQIEVIDTWGADNGWIFQWWIDFNPNILPSEWGFTPQIIDNGWVTSPSTVSIDGDIMTIDPAEPGSYDYSYEVVDDYGCAYEDEIAVEVTSFIELGSSETENDYCGQSIGTAEIQGTGGTPQYAYYWSSLNENTALVEDLQFGFYNYSITDQLGCTYEGTIEVGNDVAELLLEVTSFENDACNQGVGQININPLNGLGPYTYDWNHPSANGNPATNLNQGLYSVDVSDIGGCVGTITQYIDNILGPNANFHQNFDTVIYVHGDVNFVDISYAAEQTNIASWFWSFGDGDFSTSQNPSHDFDQISEYLVELTVTDANGCEDTYSSSVVAVEDYFIWAPNAFSPNGDDLNEIFRPIIQNFILSSFNFYIYDRWGKLVYQSDNYYSGWDGIRMNNGIAADTDSYYSYVVKFNTHHNVLVEYTGVVLIIR
jgi:gliding motility-associated-like protein